MKKHAESNYISSLIFIEGNLYNPNDQPINESKKILAFIINNSNFVLGKPFMYQFGYINNAPKITKIVKTSPPLSPNEFYPTGDYNNSFELPVSENTPEEFTIYYSDNQPYDNSYILPDGITIIKQNYFGFTDITIGTDNHIKFEDGILKVKINDSYIRHRTIYRR